jgi:hypothetical protein
MQAFALIDYDNVKVARRETSSADVFANIETVVGIVSDLRRGHFSQVGEIIFRIYGGWITESGHYSQLAAWLLAVIGDFRGRRAGVRIRVELATDLVSAPGSQFIGTQRRYSGEIVQKMVDSMMTIDLLHLSAQSDCPLIIYSDDDDFIPSALHAATYYRPPALLRSRQSGIGLNDHLVHRFDLFHLA